MPPKFGETEVPINSTTVSWSCLKEDFDDVFRVFEDLLKNPEFRTDKIEIAQKGMYDDERRSIPSHTDTEFGRYDAEPFPTEGNAYYWYTRACYWKRTANRNEGVHAIKDRAGNHCTRSRRV